MSAHDTPARVRKMLAAHFSVDEDKCSPGALLVEDLGADSLDILELVIDAEEELDVQISDFELEEIKTVADVTAVVERALR